MHIDFKPMEITVLHFIAQQIPIDIVFKYAQELS